MLLTQAYIHIKTSNRPYRIRYGGKQKLRGPGEWKKICSCQGCRVGEPLESSKDLGWGGSQDSMWGSLAKMANNSRDMEPEEPTSSSQTGPLVEGWGHQPTYKTLNPKLLPCKRNAGTKWSRLKEWLASDCPHLGNIPSASTNV